MTNLVSDNSLSAPWLIAVHGGAGDHSTNADYEKAVKHALRSACTQAVHLHREDGQCIDTIERAIMVLEDAGCLNAGNGSNLTLEGQIECDASLMNGSDGSFGGVGAAQLVKNPIGAARAVLENSRTPQPLGRIPPLTIVGEGAHRFAASRGLATVRSDELVTSRAQREWRTWKDRLDCAIHQAAAKENAAEPPEHLPKGDIASMLGDTVGAVSCDAHGGMAAGVSSGGLLLKYPGRVGEAAVYGAGVWAHSPIDSLDMRGVTCSVSGTGEDIIRSSLARTIATALFAVSVEDAPDVLCKILQNFCDECKRRGEESPSAGVIVITKEPLLEEFVDDDISDSDSDFVTEFDSANTSALSCASAPANDSSMRTDGFERRSADKRVYRLRLWCAFTTSSMAIAYASSNDPKPRALILRKPHHQLDRNGHVFLTALPLTRS